MNPIVFVAPFQSYGNNRVEYFEDYSEKLDDLERKYGCEILELKPYLSGKDLKSIFVDTCHFNNEGNALVAEAVFELLKRQWDRCL